MTSPPRPRYPAPVPGLAVRKAALRMLDAVLRRGEPLERALHAATQGIKTPADRGLAHAIASETLRWLPDLDALIDSATRNPLPEDAKARMVLRLALTQALRLGTPPHAAIATALPLVDGGPRRLVHGVFGTLMRGEAALSETPMLPAEVTARWEAQWGATMVANAAAALAAPPPLDISLADPTATAEQAAQMAGESLMAGHVRLTGERKVPEIEGYAEGGWWVQDLAASLPARLLGKGEGQRALDLCAAPGGKAMQLAAAGWQVGAIDKSQRRIERMAANFERTGLDAEMIAADLADWAPESPAQAVLLDAPCSATGIFRRHPDVLHRIGARDIAERADLQAQLLLRAADWVAPGGQLVYATCSLERAEGEEQVPRFLESRRDYAIVPVRPEELPEGIAPAAEGWVRTLPTMLADKGRLDGFFMVRLTRS